MNTVDKRLINKYLTYENGTLRCNLMGNIVGYIGANGYYRTKFLGKPVSVHHLIWIMHNGIIPNGMFVDHIDRDITNNKISNLRLVTPSGNSQNTKNSTRNTSGTKGVCWHKSTKKWKAYITLEGVYKHIGVFETKIDAIKARKKTEQNLRFLTNKLC